MLTRVAARAIWIILSLMILFHLLVLFSVIPYDMVWGGRLESRQQMLRFESVSILLNLGMLVITGIKAGMIKWRVRAVFITILLWIMFVLFALNTLGNLMSVSLLEKAIFTPFTAILALSCLILALDKRSS